jgi:outer membrane lipoprotein carrier protein
MKKLLIVPVFLFVSCLAWSQNDPNIQDPAAKKVLDRAAAKASSLKSIQADFQLLIEDKKDNSKNSSNGSVVMKKEKYKVITAETIVYFDGKTMWTHNVTAREVIITQPEKSEDDFFSNPASLFNLYDKDFKYRYVKETLKNGLSYDEIDMYPKKLDQPYSRVKVFVNKKTELPEIITTYGKDGVNYTFTLSNYKLDQDLTDAMFTFDPAKNKKVEVVDMRGTK